MNKDGKVFVAGHSGLVGSAIYRLLQSNGYSHIITRTHKELDLMQQSAVEEFFAEIKPEYVFLAAAKVGGIFANNTYPADFIYQNLLIQSNVVHQSYLNGVKRLLFLGSSCIYPRLASQPIHENDFMTGPLEPTNRAYAIAKIAGVEMCWSYNRQYGTTYIPVMPTNIYGPGDNYDLETSHVLPAMIRKFHLAKLATNGDYNAIALDEQRHGKIPDDFKRSLGMDIDSGGVRNEPVVSLWGTGRPYREFLYVDDLADACLFLMNQPDDFLLNAKPDLLFNIGMGTDVSIKELSEIIARVVGYEGKIVFDPQMPDGMPKKLLETSKMRELGWIPRIQLEQGIHDAYMAYLN